MYIIQCGNIDGKFAVHLIKEGKVTDICVQPSADTSDQVSFIQRSMRYWKDYDIVGAKCPHYVCGALRINNDHYMDKGDSNKTIAQLAQFYYVKYYSSS